MHTFQYKEDTYIVSGHYFKEGLKHLIDGDLTISHDGCIDGSLTSTEHAAEEKSLLGNIRKKGSLYIMKFFLVNQDMILDDTISADGDILTTRAFYSVSQQSRDYSGTYSGVWVRPPKKVVFGDAFKIITEDKIIPSGKIELAQIVLTGTGIAFNKEVYQAFLNIEIQKKQN